jgi:ribonuclease Z
MTPIITARQARMAPPCDGVRRIVRTFVRLVLVVLVLLGTAYAVLMSSETVQDALFRRAVESRVPNGDSDLYGKDSLDLVFCGTGGPITGPDRTSACIAVFGGGHLFLVDTGPGASRRLNLSRVPPGGLTGVLYTHYHSDHIGGLGEIVLNSWATGRHTPLRIYGPPGIESIALGFETAYRLDSGYRTAHHGADIFPPEGSRLEPVAVVVPNDDAVVTVFESGDFKITAFRVSHPPIDPSYGYRVDYAGRSVIFSGDTLEHPNVARIGKDVDVMVHEALAEEMALEIADLIEQNAGGPGPTILRDATTNHATPVEAAESANEANARLLVYSHVVPPLPNRLAERMFLRGVSGVRPGETVVGYDGLHLELPVGSTEIIHNDRS